MNTWDGARWRTSTYSGTQENCVEVAPVAGEVGVRDSKRRDGGQLVVPSGSWLTFARWVSQRG